VALIERRIINHVSEEEALAINATLITLDGIRYRLMYSTDKTKRRKAIHADRMIDAIHKNLTRKFYLNAEKNLPSYP
jgi:hypothetical protein